MDSIANAKRRSHLNRRSAEKGLRITERDVVDIFEPLSRHRRLTTRQLVAYGARHPLVTKLRLTELWHATQGERSHWLHRANEEIVFANHLTVEDLHQLGTEAHTLLVARGIVPPGEWVSRAQIGGASHAPSKVVRLAHDHMASDIALDIEIGARAAQARYTSHVEILLNAPEMTRSQKRPLQIPVTLSGARTYVEPDALFAINGHVFALEADKGTESVATVVRQKILAYREIVAAGIIDEYLGVDNLKVLIATTSVKRMRHIMDELALIARNGKSTMFGFRAEEAFGDFLKAPIPTGRLFSEPWGRVGHPLFTLAELPG